MLRSNDQHAGRHLQSQALYKIEAMQRLIWRLLQFETKWLRIDCAQSGCRPHVCFFCESCSKHGGCEIAAAPASLMMLWVTFGPEHTWPTHIAYINWTQYCNTPRRQRLRIRYMHILPIFVAHWLLAQICWFAHSQNVNGARLMNFDGADPKNLAVTAMQSCPRHYSPPAHEASSVWHLLRCAPAH